MYIGNIHWKHCSLETSFLFGNMDRILETQIGYWKHIKAFGNKICTLETYVLYWKHRLVYWKQCIWKHENDTEYQTRRIESLKADGPKNQTLGPKIVL